MKNLLRLAAAQFFLAVLIAAQAASVYVPAKDGTRLAVDVHLPDDVAVDSDEEQVPVLLELTRYWRSREAGGRPIVTLSPLDRKLLEAGYALVKVDVRGSGASFGNRQMEYGRQEVRDGYDIVDWVVAQPWCDGAVGAYGTSYTGTTAELLCATGHPAIRAVIPGWSDYDLYRSPARPYGVPAIFIDEWGSFVAGLDGNGASAMGDHGVSVRRVDEDKDGALVAAARKEHASNFDVAAAVGAAEYRDDAVVAGGDTYHDASSLGWQKEIEASGVPMLVLASWLDAGTAEGALHRFQNFSNPQKLVILASSHGGLAHASPFAVKSRRVAPVPSNAEQYDLRVAFLDHYLKGVDNEVADWAPVRYFNLGEEGFHETDVWPPKDTQRLRFFAGADGVLAREPGESGWDEYEVDFEVTTGNANRWSTQMGRPVLGLHDRGATDARMLTYTTAPLEKDLQVTGTPVVTLQVTSTADDGLILIYLEDVDPQGQSRYISEGGLRALHRKPVEGGDPATGLPMHTFERADAMALVPGKEVQVTFRLHPTSVLFRAGHRIRVALAGADADSFASFPGGVAPTLRLRRGPGGTSIELPVRASD